MTKRKAEVLTGYEVRRISKTGDGFCYGAYHGENLLVQAEHRKESIALTLLVNRVYQIHSRQVLDEQGWKCTRCGRSYGLQVHHRQFRSRGGTHRPENLEPVCWECHRRIHAGTLETDPRNAPVGFNRLTVSGVDAERPLTDQQGELVSDVSS